ncbi:TonB-dependent receptor [Snuella sedimenti]|uniref:TonB-dependent receptor n=1 Tax=Snuella sedimenti TaxID=2798802 RepID=A0A8J7J4I8_9FLAO|nr:TonB-dependent receptor [Snuella sedimenti]MBJ6369757.1 TonB-dependent receptor [Snuella sedimenti]
MKKNQHVFSLGLFVSRIMKIYLFLLCITMSNIFAFDSYAQKISLDEENVTIKKILNHIERKSGLNFFYNTNMVDVSSKVSLKIENEELEKTLNLLFEGTDIDYSIIKEHIVLFPKNNEEMRIKIESIFKDDDVNVDSKTNEKNKEFNRMISQAISSLVQAEISGTIVDEGGVPLPGVSVVIKGTTKGTVTDIDGNYNINVNSSSDVLVFSYLGFMSQEIAVGNQKTINITMIEDVATLEEVVVVGYGTQKKKEVTSAVVSVDSEELNQSSVANISNALVGRLPGLVATQRGGQPGSNGSNLLVRGISTTGSSAPLIIVDGVQRSFSQFDPNTIETITVLKDASAAAVYGVRGANGVILITTKRGKSGKPVISYTSEITTTKPTQLPNYLGSYDYAVLFNEAKRNEGKAELYTADDLEKYRTGSDPLTHPNTDWYDVGLKDSAIQQQHTISISGGSEKVRYFASGGFISEGGLMPFSDYKRYNFRANLDFDITERLKVSLDMAGRQENRMSPSSGVGSYFSGLSRMAPNTIAYYSNGLPGPAAFGSNPIEAARSGGVSESTNNIFLANVNFEYKIPYIEGLTLKGYVAIDRLYNATKTIQKEYQIYNYNESTQEYNPSTQGQSSLSQSYFQGAPNSGSGAIDPTMTYNATLNYDTTIDDVHHITGLLGVEKAINKSSGFNASRLNLVSDALPQLDFGDSGTAQNGGIAFNSARLGYIARVTYAYDEKYLFESAFRYDASENFAKENRFGFFPSFSLGWRLSQEDFMQNVDFINELKLRGSWGRLGNDRISQFQYLDAFNFSGSYILGGSPVQAIRPGVIPNTEVTWETATTTNIGFNLEVMERKLGIEFDYFTKRTEDILEAPTRIVPNFVGASLPRENFGIVDNKGFEISTSYRNHVGDFDYWIKANYTKAKNEIIEIGESTEVPVNLRETGRSIGSRFGLIAEGFFQSQDEIDNHADQGPNIAPGDIKYKDINGDGTINNDDRDFIGVVSSPNIIYGFSFGGSYKGFDFSAQFQGAADFNVYLSEEAAFPFFNGGKVLAQHLDRWTPETPNARFPRTLTEDTNNRRVSSFWLQNADYIRLKNVEIGYNFSSDLISKLKLDQLRLYVSGLNIFTISDIENFDPEAPSGRGAFYPQTRSFTLGLNVSF